MSIVIIEEKHNPLLNRIEVKCKINGKNGNLKRGDAAKLLAEALNYSNRFIVPISMQGEHGKNDLKCLFYVYEDENTARKQLPKYIIARLTGEKVEKKGKGKSKDKKE
jgi:ribosomal protein S24E